MAREGAGRPRILHACFGPAWWWPPRSVQIPREEQDRFFLRHRLLPELPGILTWAVEGCSAWQRTGLGVPREVQEATADYRAHMDHVARFVAECCAVAGHLTEAVKDLYAAYSN